MYKRLVSWALLAIIILATLVPTILSAPSSDEPPIWDNDWAFRQEITLPINTSSEYAHYQPIDICIEFDDICWAKDENEHSLRVCFWDGIMWHPVELQIYDLNYTDNEHIIRSCGLVFLIPEEANGEERYYVHYDDDKKSNPNYPNHVDVSEGYYRYQQIPGVIFESDYYEIIEEGYIVYGVNKEGKALDVTATTQVAKLITGTENIAPNKGEIGASFDFRYWWMEDGKWHSPYKASRLVKNQIIVDGNLMVKVGIESESPDGFLKSTVIYKYYYCPTEDKRIYAHVKHEVIDYPLPIGEKIDVGYAYLGYGTVKSSTIEDLNFGKLYPYLHFYSDEERIKEYNVPQFPEEELQPIIIKEEDPDLGSSPWVSVDDGEKGKAHAIIFESTNVTKSGYTGRDGITLELFEASISEYIGLNARLAMLFILKDTYEEGEKFLNTLPKDFVVEFNAEFFTTENGGYLGVAEEAKMYQSLIQYQSIDDDIIDEKEEIERFNLTASVHFAPSFPLGFFLSTGFGYNASYLTAEVYKESSITSSNSGTVTRVSLEGDVPPDLTGLTLLELLDLLDWKNRTRCKKVHLPYLEKGRYLIKIFREDPLFGEERQFIGYAIVDLDKDKEIRIYCKREGKVSLSFLNQDKIGIENAQIYLKKDDFIIANSESNSDGKTIIKAPCGLREKYSLNVIYKGFLIKEEQIRLGRIRRLIPLKKAFSFDVYDLEIIIRDSEGKIPDFDIELSLTSKEMHDPVSLKEDNAFDGVHKFNDLYPANYILTIKYNSYEIKQEIKIPDIDSLEIKLYDFTAYIKDIWNLSPGAKLDVIIISEDFEKTAMILGEQLSPKKYYFANLYPGNYILKVRYKTYTIEELINIPDRENIEIIFPALYNITVTIYDSHGDPLKDAKVLIIRDIKEVQGITNEEGEVIFSLPPGSYETKIFSDGDLIAKRQVEIFDNNKYKVVTTDEPLLPYITIGLSVLAFIGLAVISYRKKDAMLLLKIFAIFLVVVAFLSPWWEVNGLSSNHDAETSTKMFLTPTKMVTITSNNNITAGEVGLFDEKSMSIVSIVDTVLPIAIIISFIFIILSLIFSRYSQNRFSIMVFLSAIVFYIVIIVIFLSEMSKLINPIVGNLIGSGNLDISIPGEKLFETMSCSWGPGIGFYLLLCSTIILIFAFYLNTRKTIFKYLKKIKK